MKNEFEWTDELVFEFTNFYEEYCKSHPLTWTSVAAEAFKKSKEPKKDYEILSFKQKTQNSEMLFNKREDGLFYSDDWVPRLDELKSNGFTEDKLLESVSKNGVFIRSVKVLPDVEIFAVGDDTNHGLITEFIISEPELYARCERGKFNINELKKAPKPLFKTEDGKEVFEGDRVWFVDNGFDIYFYDFNKMEGMDDLKHYPEKYKYFSTEEVAKRYILMNKPMHSVNDILLMFRNNENISSYKDDLIKVSEAKL